MIHAREKPRQLPSWVAGDLPAPVDNTARVLQFPPSGADTLRAASAEPARAAPQPLGDLSSAAAPRQSDGVEGLRGSVLSPEPAYKLVLERLASAASRDSTPAVSARLDGQALRPAEPSRASLATERREQQQQPQPARPASAAHIEAAEAPPQPPGCDLPSPQRRPPLPSPDPALQLQLKERIERAKAEIKQQLSPLFRVSQALLAPHQDPAQAAAALEGVTAAAQSGDGGGGLPAGRGGSGLAPGLGLRQPSGGRESGAQLLPAVLDNPLFEQASLHGREGRAGSLPAAADDVDSLVLSARAAVSKAQSAIADLASPPRSAPGVLPPPTWAADTRPATTPSTAAVDAQPSVHKDAREGVAAEARTQPLSQLRVEVGGGEEGCAQPPQQPGSAPQAQQPLPQQPGPLLALPGSGALAVRHHHQPPQQQQHHNQQQQDWGGPLVPLPEGEPLAADLEGHIAQLRRRSEAMIQQECSRLVAAMHAMYDDFLRSVHTQGLLVRVSVGSGGGVGSPAAAASPPGEPRPEWPVPSAPPALAQPVQQEQQQQQLQQQCPAQSSAMQPAGEAPAHQVGEGEHGSEEVAVQPTEVLGGSGAESQAAPGALEPAAAFEFPSSGSSSPAAEEAALAEAGGLGFGSPIRLSASRRASPAKGYGAAGPQRAVQPSFSAAPVSMQRATPAPPSPLSAASAARALPSSSSATAAEGPGGWMIRAQYGSQAGRAGGALFAGGLPSTTTTGRGAAEILPAAQQGGRRLAAAGSAAAPAASWARQPPGGSTPAAAAPAGQRGDLDSIVNSIRRLAAETRLKQSTLPPPNSRLLQPGPASLKLVGVGTAAATPPPPRLQERLASLQQPALGTPASAYKTPLSQLASSGTVRGAGGGRLHSILPP